jgi:hypothetical protein
MGSGTVTDIDSDGACYIIKFDALATSRRISFRAKLEKL